MNNRKRWEAICDRIESLERTIREEKRHQGIIKNDARELFRWIDGERLIGGSPHLKDALRHLADELDGDDQTVFQVVLELVEADKPDQDE